MIPVKSYVLLAIASVLAGSGSVQASTPLGSGLVPVGGLNALSSGHDLPVVNRRHGFAHRRAAANALNSSRKSKRQDRQRCRVRDGASPAVALASSSSDTPAATTPTTPAVEAAPTTAQISQANAVPAGMINVVSQCGDIGATPETSVLTGPNGKLDWLNCGIADGGWNPPYIQITDLVTMDLGQALQNPNSPFHACEAYIDQFYRYGGQFNIPPIMLASFAMQESSCRADTVGGAGEMGLMQLTHDKCNEAPGGNCQDPDYNIMTGAKYFAQSLAENNGNVLLTIGRYNGWYQGLTIGAATAAAINGNCRAQNNLDYLHQFCNGWLQNVDAYTVSPPLGKYFNLNQCH